ncbi:MAG: 5-methylcytosine-specific restriction endonuclease McrA [Myxococcota bacterium]|jgi:5-methylcytosine-specific restriction endonuclease McrA
MARRAVLFLEVIRTDATFQPRLHRGEVIWQGKCIHCGSRLSFDVDGEPLGGATLEHIMPRNHGGGDNVENLAAACARCNHAKGRQLDHRRADDPDLQVMLAQRAARWRPAEEAPDPSLARLHR